MAMSLNVPLMVYIWDEGAGLHWWPCQMYDHVEIWLKIYADTMENSEGPAQTVL